jgi:hypothetical protein
MVSESPTQNESDDHQVQWGDIVFFKHENILGYLHADGTVDDRLGLMKPTSNATAPDDMNHCIFMLCPPLKYIAQKQLDKMKRHSSSGKEFEAMVQQAAGEAKRNSVIVKSLLNGSSELQFPIDYGTEIQLYHVSSQRFVTGARESATCQKDGLKLTLDEKGGKLSHYKMMPRYSFKTEGSPITYGNCVQLESTKLVGHNISASTLPYDPVELEPSERDGNLNEVNMHVSKTGWNMGFYERTMPEFTKYLSIRDYFCIYHSEADGFLYSSNEPHQCKVHCIAPIIPDGGVLRHDR